MKARVAVVISGGGSNAQALIDASRSKDYPAEIVLVASNRPRAGGLDRARAAGIETAVVDHKAYHSREAFEDDLHAALAAARPDAVCLAGFMRVLTEGFVRRWEGQLLNIHPSLLPLFKGTHVHAQALAAGVAVSGATVHLVTPALDDGPIIGQAAVPVRNGDTEETLAARVLAAEHLLYPLALRKHLTEEAGPSDPPADVLLSL
jgi:phosphoribosylglycinamide formyltransferase-1